MADYLGKDIFKLGFGLMRLPKNEDGSIDVPQTSDMVDAFIAAGGTYFDTAFVYPGSEDAIKQALVDRHPRESYTLATKLNAWLGEPDREAAKQQLYTSLERTGAGYFDFYLLHAIMRTNYETYEKYGLWDFVKEQKEKGVIKHWGFSFHADPDLLEQVLTEHPDVEFVQLQINYADWENPGTASQKCWEIARKHGVPIVVMEPLKGGALADPIPAVRQIFEEANPEAPIVSWGIRYSAGLEGIITVLSGMSSLEQMEENLSYMKDFKPLDEAEMAGRAQRGPFHPLHRLPLLHRRLPDEHSYSGDHRGGESPEKQRRLPPDPRVQHRDDGEGESFGLHPVRPVRKRLPAAPFHHHLPGRVREVF